MGEKILLGKFVWGSPHPKDGRQRGYGYAFRGQSMEDGLKLVYCMAVCYFRWQYVARWRNGYMACHSLNTGETYKSKTNVLDVYGWFLVSLLHSGFYSFWSCFLYQKGTLLCLLINGFAGTIHSKHFAQFKPALF